MKILALDTSSTVAGASVVEDDKVLGEYMINSGRQHSIKLMPMVKSLLSNLNMGPQDMDVFAVSTGPGSFTGLRIGITVVKAMAYAADKPVAGIPTLDALAYNMFSFSGIICPVMDARNNQVYTSFYKWNKDKLMNIGEYSGEHIEELVKRLSFYKEDVIFTGDALNVYKSFFMNRLGKKAYFAPANLSLQRASSIAQLARIKIENGELESSFELLPFYLRKPQAVREYEKPTENTGDN